MRLRDPGGVQGQATGDGWLRAVPDVSWQDQKLRAARALRKHMTKIQLRCLVGVFPLETPVTLHPLVRAEWLQGRPARATDKEKLCSRDPSLCFL